MMYHLPRTRLFYSTFLRFRTLSWRRTCQEQLFILLLRRRKQQIPLTSDIFLSILPLSLRYAWTSHLHVVHLFKLLRKIALFFRCRYKTLINGVHHHPWSGSQAALTQPHGILSVVGAHFIYAVHPLLYLFELRGLI